MGNVKNRFVILRPGIGNTIWDQAEDLVFRWLSFRGQGYPTPKI